MVATSGALLAVEFCGGAPIAQPDRVVRSSLSPRAALQSSPRSPPFHRCSLCLGVDLSPARARLESPLCPAAAAATAAARSLPAPTPHQRSVRQHHRRDSHPSCAVRLFALGLGLSDSPRDSPPPRTALRSAGSLLFPMRAIEVGAVAAASSTAPSLRASHHAPETADAVICGPYPTEPMRAGAGLSSSSSSSSSSLTSPASMSGAAQSGDATKMADIEHNGAQHAQAEPLQLPEELIADVLGYLDWPQLACVASVQKQWNELHADDEYWVTLYARWYGDSMRLNERKSWKFNFCARDRMLAKLGQSMAMLAHPERERRVESVSFLRAHCEFLTFLLDPPSEQLPRPVAIAIAQPAGAEVPLAIPIAESNTAQTPAAALAVAAGPHAADAAAIALAAAVPVPDSTLRALYTRPPVPPPVSHLSRLPARSSLEFKHAQHLIKDALVNQGWRRLFPSLCTEEQRTPQVTPIVQRGADATALPFASSRFPFPRSAAASSSSAASAAASSPSNDAFDASTAAMDTGAPTAAEPAFAAASPESTSFSPSSSPPALSGYRSPFPACDRSIEYGSVLVAWTEHPWLSFEAVSRELDDIALQVVARMEHVSMESEANTGTSIKPAQLPFHVRLQCLHHVLYIDLGFHGNQHEFYTTANSFVHLVLRKRTGIPISLSIVYMAVAARLGIDVQGVNSPGHFLLRVEDRQTNEAGAAGAQAAAPDAAATAPPRPSSASSSFAASSAPSVYYVDAFSGNLMSPSVTLNFLSLFGGAVGIVGGGLDDSRRRDALLRPCNHAALFVRMYRNLMNLYQDPRTISRRIAESGAHASLSAASPPAYEMEASLHHCASQIVELMRLCGDADADVTSAVFIDRFRFAGGMS